MNNIVKMGMVALSVSLLSACVSSGPQASFKDRLKDNFAFTSASSVPAGQVKCVYLAKPFTFQSGSVTYTLPAGHYKGKQRNSSGYFYNTPAHIQVSSYFAGSVYGIYINNQFTQGNLFGVNPEGYDDRPVRGTVLPSSIFSYLRKSGNC